MSHAASPLREQLEYAQELRSGGHVTDALDILATPVEYSAQLCAMRAEMEFELGRFGDAALSYFSVTLSDPQSSDAHFNLALCLDRCGRWDVATEAFQQVLRLDPDRKDARLGLGGCLLHLNRAEEALLTFNQCCRGWEPGPALIGKAVALQALERFDEAGRAYEALLASIPDSEEALSNLIAMSIEAHDLERARDHCMRLLEIRPHSIVALQGLAAVAFQCEDHPAAAGYCNQILKVAPDCLEAWHNFRIAMDRCSFTPSRPALAMRSGGK